MPENSFNANIKRINVLFVGGGRRNTLAQMFKARGCNVYSYELDPLAPIRTDAILVDGVSFKDETFKKHLEQVVKHHYIDIVIPLQDEAIPLCSEIKGAVCSPYESSIYCTDKFLFEQFMLDNFRGWYPEYQKGEKAIKKPRFGFGSQNIEIVNEEDEDDKKCVYQSYKEGKEYTVDAYFDVDSKMVAASPRERIRVAGGEVVDSITVENSQLKNMTQVVGESLGLVGPVCMQYIVEDGNSSLNALSYRPFLFEINARFGGGSTLSIHAGLDMIEMIKKEYIEKEKLCASHYKVDDNMMLKRVFKDTYWKVK